LKSEIQQETDFLSSYRSFFCVLLLDSVYTLLLVIHFLLDLGLVEAVYDRVVFFRNVYYDDIEQGEENECGT
jgi:hypothetical protein